MINHPCLSDQPSRSFLNLALKDISFGMVRLAFIVGTFYPALLTVGLAAPYPNLYVGSNSSLATTNFSSGTINYANAFVGYSDVGNTANVVSNTLSIVFAGTVLNLSSNAYIGYNGYNGSNNEMEVAAGGVVTDSNGYIGYSNNSSGNYASVLGSENGSNSLWSNSGTLTVGYSGGGTLTLANGGTVVAAGGLTIASNSGSVGTLNIGSYGGSDTSGILIAPTISFGSGTGTINFNQTNAFTLTNAITGAGSIQQLGTGTTILTGSNTYSLGTVITAGTLQIGDGITDGSIQGNVTNSAQLVFDPAASSTALFSGTVTNVGANSDVLISSGTLQLGNGSSTSSILGFTDTNSDGGSGGKALTATNGANFLNSTSAFIAGGYGGKGSGGSSNGYSATAGSGGGAGGGAVSYAGTGILSNAGSIGGGFGGNGGNGATGSSEGSSGGSGGAGGGGISFAGMGVMSNSGSVTGGYGGSGGYGGNANYSSEYASYAGSGGSGGAGGGGISFAGMGVMSNSGSITGGAGGNGGAGGYALNNNAMGGAGGNAGNGVSFGGTGFLTNSGTIAGGSSGNGGYNGNFPAISGNGGMGVSFIGSGTLINSGTISGGNNGFSQFGPPTPSLALGVVFSGASNTLVNLGSGTINGGVSMAGSNNLATLFTGGVIKGPLDIGGAQSSTLTLDGQGTASWSTAVTGTTSFGGSLIKQGAGTWKIDSSLGNPTSALITAGTLQAEITNALGAGEVTLTNSATLSLATNLIVSSLLWNSTATVALNPNTYLTSTGVVTLTGAGTNDFNLSGWSLGSSPVELLSYGSGSLLSTKDFSALGVSGYTLSQSNNALWIFINLPDLYVGSNSTVTPTNFTSGTNIYGNTYVGYATNADKNLLTISGQGTILTNSTYLEVGVSGSGNRMVVTNGGVVTDATGNIGLYAEASNNSVLVAGAGSTWSNRFNINVGEAGSSNSVVISGGGKVFDENGFIDSPEVNSSNNSVLVTGSGSLWSNNSDLYVGASGTSNRLVISSGATVIDSNGYIDRGLASSNNSALVTGSNSLWSNNGVLYVGYEGTGNMLSISNGGRVVVTGNTNTNDYVIGNGFVIGYAINSSNSTVTVTGSNSLLTNTSQNNDSFNVGWYGSSNSLVISNGGTVDTKYGNIGYTNGTGNSVLVTGSNSAWNGSELYVGHWNSGNSLTVSAGGHVLLDSYLGVGSFQPGANSNTAIISGAGSLLSVGSSGEIDVGGENGFGNSLLITNKGAVFSQTAIIGSYGGDTNISSSNSALVTGAGSVWTNTGTFTIGQTGGANSLVITNGAHVINGGDAVIGDFRTAQSNSVLVTGAGSLWSNAGTLTIGNSGSGALTLSATSAVSASSIVIASQEGSSGTVNIGTPGGNSPGGMLSTPAITFGNGSGALNFDQSNTAALTSTISGVGTIQQLGSGTSILSASNSY